MITLAAIPLKNCRQCSHYRGGYCYGFGTAKQVFSESEAILCATYTPLGQVQIGPLDSLAGQLVAYQIPSGIISTVKLADLAVTVAKLGLSSVIDSKVAAGAAIVESKLSLIYGTQALHDDIQTRVLAAAYLAHDHSVADPTQIDFNNLLNISPLILAGGIQSNSAAASWFRGGCSWYSTESGKTSWRLTYNINDADNIRIYTYDSVGAEYKKLSIGGQAGAGVVIEANNDVGIGGILMVPSGIGIGATPTALRPINISRAEVQQIYLRSTDDDANIIVRSGVGKDALFALYEDTVLKGAFFYDASQAKIRFYNYISGASFALPDAGGIELNDNLTVDGDILSANTINIKPSGDLDDYLQFLTTNNEAYIKRIGGDSIRVTTENSIYHKFIIWHDVNHYFMLSQKIADATSELFSKGNILIKPNGDLDNHIQFSTVANVPKIDGIGENPLQIDGVDVSAEPARITAEIDSDIGTHADLPNAHHAQSHTLASHSSKAHSELTGINPSDHHTAYTDEMALAAVDEHLVIGSENAEWINCPLEMWRETSAFEINVYGCVANLGGTDGYVFYSVPLPTNRGGKKLYISGTRVSLVDADVDDFVTITLIRGFTDASFDTLDTDTTDKNTADCHEDLSMGALDCSGHHVIKISLNASVTTANQLEISFVTVRYYYAD